MEIFLRAAFYIITGLVLVGAGIWYAESIYQAYSSRGRVVIAPFEVIGSPNQPAVRPYSFVPTPNAGSPTPPLKGQRCYGLDLAGVPARANGGLVLKYLLDFYQ